MTTYLPQGPRPWGRGPFLGSCEYMSPTGMTLIRLFLASFLSPPLQWKLPYRDGACLICAETQAPGTEGAQKISSK